MVAVGLVLDRRVLLHHEMPPFPTAKRAKVELRAYPKSDEASILGPSVH
jgi:hypothetical protein